MHILYAPSVHQGGGKVLMLMLIRQLSAVKDITYIIDQRLEIPQEYFPAGSIRKGAGCTRLPRRRSSPG